MKKSNPAKQKKMTIVLAILLIITLAVAYSKKDESPDAAGDFDVNGSESAEVLSDIVSDGIAEKLISFGMTEDEARAGREVLLMCGVENIDNCEPTDTSATVDGLVVFREVVDKDRVFWFTVDNREIFYVSLNGTDLYDVDKGGFLMKIDDVHVPESSVEYSVYRQLQDKTERVLDQYFVNARYYDGWGIGRADENYMVQCEVYASNALKMKDWVPAKVWYEDQGNGEFIVTGVQIDGTQYEVKP
jgi:hypothetical protein|nr:MAG TPA: hypothetical protein [Caudoviricetes sp.]